MELMCLLNMAKASFDQGNEANALKFLAQGLEIGRQQSIYHWPVWDPAICTFLCVTALKHDLEKEYVRRLIGRRRLYLTVPPLELEDWPWALRIYTMGRFSIIRDGKPVALGSRGQQKPIVLLQALIALGGRHVDEAKLADILWPDADGDLQMQTLRTTLHRLRKLVGSQEIIIHHDNQLTLNPAFCWVDTWAYERLLGTADSAWQKKQNESGAERDAGKAFSFYQGAFLPHKAGEYWTLFLRERLRRKYIASAELLGLHFEKQGRWQEAIHHYQKGLGVDHLVEEFHQRLMVCYLKLNRPAEAISTYQRCRTILATGIGIEPSSETTRIFQLIPRS
jgi:LuxR family transcriptional regulator, maltose regulon positive regulatory protein